MFKWVGKAGRFGLREAGTLIGFKQANAARQGMQDQARVVLDPRRQRESREETFQNAYQRLGLNEDVLETVYINHRRRFYTSTVLMMGALGLAVVGFSSVHWWYGLSAIAAVAVCLSQMFDSSLRTYQINQRELVGIPQWWAASSEWWPGPFVTLEEFQKIMERKARRAARKSSKSRSVAVTSTTPTAGPNDQPR